MVPVGLHQSLTDDQSQPQKQGQLGAREVFIQSGRHINIGFLNNVGCVDPRLQAVIEAQLHHPAQPMAVPGEQLTDSPGIPGLRPLDESGILRLLIPSDVAHTLLPPRQGVSWTVYGEFF